MSFFRPAGVLFLVGFALAAAADEGPLSLAEALRLVRERSPDILSARADVQAAEAQRETAAQLPNPVLGAFVTKIPTDGTPADTVYGNGFFDRAYDSIVSVGQLVEVGGKRGQRRLSAVEGVASARARLADADRQVTANVVKAYVVAVVARTNAALARETADSFAKTAGLAAEREAAGDISKSERSQIEIAAGRFQADAMLAEAARKASRVALAAITGLPAFERDPREDLEEILGMLNGALGTSLRGDDEAALGSRPDLRALEAAIRKAEAELALQKAYRVPDPTFQAQYERQPPDQRNTVGFGVSLPLPVLSRNAGGIAAAEAVRRAARQDLERAVLRARADLVLTRAAADAAAARDARFADDLVPKAERVRETVRYAWSQGGASLLELLEAERSANEIRLAASQARGDLVTARADFAAARALPILGPGSHKETP